MESLLQWQNNIDIKKSSFCFLLVTPIATVIKARKKTREQKDAGHDLTDYAHSLIAV
jgi:hypothetical protein